MINLETKVIKDCEGKKSVISIDHRSGMFRHSTLAMILKSKNRKTAIKGFTLLKEAKQENSRRVYIKLDVSGDLKSEYRSVSGSAP